MRAYLDQRQSLHNPQHFLVAGAARPSPERPERIAALSAGVTAAGLEITAPTDHGLVAITRVHDPLYIEFLQTIHDTWQSVDGAGQEVIPNVHPMRHAATRPTGPVGLAGYHQADTACPIGPDTWQSAYWSVQSALSAAQDVQNGVNSAYALCRPPGHHAFGDMAGGFCFLNNAAIAAQYLSDAGRRVAILDIDVHHGNGTQVIFIERPDILTVSTHTDPSAFYPFFWGYAHETGEGDGTGTNLNIPLPRGTGDDSFCSALMSALDRVAQFDPDVVVLALGFDTSADDPFQAMQITQKGFERIGSLIASTGHPTVIVQEGGYPSGGLARNAQAFFQGFLSEGS